MSSNARIFNRYRLLSTLIYLILVMLFYWGTTTVVRNINFIVQIRYLFPAALLFPLLAYLLTRSARNTILVVSTITLIGAALIYAVSRSMLISGLILLFNAILLLIALWANRDQEAFVKRSAASAFGIILALLLSEGLARLIAPRGAGSSIEQAEDVIFSTHVTQVGQRPEWAEYTRVAVQADSTMVFVGRDSQHEITFNSKGLRGPELPYEKPADTIRIMFLGDSYIQAVQVPDEALITRHLADQITRDDVLPGYQVEVFGVGVNGWGTINEYMYFRHEGYRYQPDLVIVPFIINDPFNNLPLNSLFQSGEPATYQFVITGDDIVVEDSMSAREEVKLAAQRLLEAMPALIRSRSSLWLMLYQRAVPPLDVVAVPGAGADTLPDEAWARTAAALRLLNARITENGGQLVIMLVPGVRSMETENDPYQIELEARLRTLTTEQDIPFLALRSAYQAALDSGAALQPDIYLIGDEHWSARGHALTARIIHEWLVDTGLYDTLIP